MAMTFRNEWRNVMNLTWQFIKRNGYTVSEALKCAWANIKLRATLNKRIVRFYFQKVNGGIEEAYGTLKTELIPETKGDDRRRSDSVQVCFDTEKSEYRCFKKANLIRIAQPFNAYYYVDEKRNIRKH